MTTWNEFVERAPHVSEVFARRHAATDNLCMLATLRSDGYPRISPVEPRVFEGRLWLVGMPYTAKFRDLARDARFSLHTATADSTVREGDAKLWGTAHDVRDTALHQRFATDLFQQTGFDLRGQEFDHFYATEILGASAVEVETDHMNVTVWKPGEQEYVVEKR